MGTLLLLYHYLRVHSNVSHTAADARPVALLPLRLEGEHSTIRQSLNRIVRAVEVLQTSRAVEVHN